MMRLFNPFHVFFSWLKADQLTLAIRLMLLLAVNTLFKEIQIYYALSTWTFGSLTLVAWAGLLMLIYFKNLGNHWSHWLLIAGALAAYLIANWPASGNHLYIFIYLCLILFVCFLNQPEQRLDLLSTNTKWLFLTLMGFAVIQKVITPGYLDGSINSFWLVNGGYFKPLYYLSDHWSASVQKNHELLNQYYNYTTTKVDKIILHSPTTDLRKWAKLLSFFILAGELVLSLIFILSKSQIIKHLSVILFILVVSLTRQETGFFCILCIIGISSCTVKQLRMTYCIIFGVLQGMFLFDLGQI